MKIFGLKCISISVWYRNFMSNENVIFIMVKKYQQIMQDLRMKIAERYKNRERVASYNIMNEPYNGRKNIFSPRILP